MISVTTDYALRVVAFLASTPEQPQTSQAIVEATGVPSGYLSKVMACLARAGLIGAQRGLHGGYRLTRSPLELNAYSVLEAVEGPPRARDCAWESQGKEACKVHKLVQAVEKGARETLEHITLDQLVD